MKLYRMFNRLVTEAEAIAVLEIYRNSNGHHCNRVADRSACCPVAHGGDPSECDCLDLRRLISIELEGGDHAEITLHKCSMIYDHIADKILTTKYQV